VKSDDSFLALSHIYILRSLQSGSLSQIIIIVHIRPDPLPCKAVSHNPIRSIPNPIPSPR
jgi:hypothetical protein